MQLQAKSPYFQTSEYAVEFTCKCIEQRETLSTVKQLQSTVASFSSVEHVFFSYRHVHYRQRNHLDRAVKLVFLFKVMNSKSSDAEELELCLSLISKTYVT